MATRLVLIHALSPLHAGTGQAVGAIDLPIARERPTGIPLLPGSSLKGALRDRCKDSQLRRDLFGPDTQQASDHSGSVYLSDAQVVLLPVRSVAGTFAWTTSPYLLRRLAREAKEAGLSLPLPAAPATASACRVAPGSALEVPLPAGRKVILEDLDFSSSADDPHVKGLANALARQLFPGDGAEEEMDRRSVIERLCVVHDDAMALLLQAATEVTARVRLDDEKKTVAKGALWYEEALPAETVLAGLAVAYDVKAIAGQRSQRSGAELLSSLKGLVTGMVQLGGKATVGRGSCRVLLAGGGT